MEHLHNVTRCRSRYQTLVIFSNGNVIKYNLRITQEYFQPKIGRKIRIFCLGRKNNIFIEKKSVAGIHENFKRGRSSYILENSQTIAGPKKDLFL